MAAAAVYRQQGRSWLEALPKQASKPRKFPNLNKLVSPMTLKVLVKFRRYLSAEQSIERELRIEQLREEIDQLRANNPPAS